MSTGTKVEDFLNLSSSTSKLRRALFRPSVSAADLDSTVHRVRGRGVLASLRDVNLPPDEFASGCKLLQAAATANASSVQALLLASPRHVHFRDYDRRTALHVAASEGHLSIVQLLVEKYGAQVNRSDRWGGSPLDDAHRHQHLDVVKYLRAHGGTTGSADKTTNLITAAAEGDLDEVRVLLSFTGPPPRATAAVLASAQQSAQCSAPNTAIDIDAGDYDKRTALHLAAGEGHRDVVELLCKKGATVNIEDRWGERPLDDAMRRNFTDCIQILLKYGAVPKSDYTTASSHNDPAADEERALSNEDANLRIEFQELEVIDRIGGGTFGEIYKCRWRGILVAAKCIKSTKIVKEWQAHTANNNDNNKEGNEEVVGKSGGGSSNDVTVDDEEVRQALADFRTETAILRSLRHPNICMLLAYSQTASFEVMISELMKCSLLDIFNANLLHNNAPLSKRRQIVYAQQLVRGMNYLHQCRPPVIHRDLKPANLLIDYNDTLKISDFGLAKLRPDPKVDSTTFVSTDQFLMTGETGSYRFMAPEVYKHETYNETVDIYSFAMIFYYLLAGRPPWAGLSGIKAVEKASMEGARPFLPREWDARIVTLLKKCWDENPTGRSSFAEILTFLSSYSRDVFKMDADSILMDKEQSSRCNCIIS